MIFCCVAIVVAMRPAFGEDSTRGDRQLDAMFQKEVLPILKQHCYECHSHEANEAMVGSCSTRGAAGRWAETQALRSSLDVPMRVYW